MYRLVRVYESYTRMNTARSSQVLIIDTSIFRSTPQSGPDFGLWPDHDQCPRAPRNPRLVCYLSLISLLQLIWDMIFLPGSLACAEASATPEIGTPATIAAGGNDRLSWYLGEPKSSNKHAISFLQASFHRPTEIRIGHVYVISFLSLTPVYYGRAYRSIPENVSLVESSSMDSWRHVCGWIFSHSYFRSYWFATAGVRMILGIVIFSVRWER